MAQRSVGEMSARVAEVVRTVEQVRSVPYVWPGVPSAASVEALGVGTCASKHALLGSRLGGLGVSSRPTFVLGSLVPPGLTDDPELQGAGDLLEVHEFLTVSVPGVGPCRVDITWDEPLVAHGLPGTLDWDGRSDMVLAVGPGLAFWSPDPVNRRAEKEALRRRLYRSGERERRDAALSAMSKRFASWREADGTEVTGGSVARR